MSKKYRWNTYLTAVTAVSLTHTLITRGWLDNFMIFHISNNFTHSIPETFVLVRFCVLLTGTYNHREVETKLWQKVEGRKLYERVNRTEIRTPKRVHSKLKFSRWRWQAGTKIWQKGHLISCCEFWYRDKVNHNHLIRNEIMSSTRSTGKYTRLLTSLLR